MTNTVGVRGPRGSYAKTRERRRAIAEAALEIVLEKGHRSLITAEVAQRAGLSEPGVLYHFPTKDDLLLAALRLSDEHEWSTMPLGESVRRAPARAAESLSRINVVRLHTAMFGESSDPAHPAHEYFKERWRAGDERMVQSIERLQAVGVVDRAIAPYRASRWIHTAWEGLQLQWLAEQDFDIAVELQSLIERILGVSMAEIDRATERSD
ncbi:TetR/AcrR family transcriptional regulator [Leifsonia sp. 21MFCrub1.1]|uniref:TetR/AcrR family transcriptional regulator n=1 Tax=Leifsonia sp. 21MFCrub1.1 TaxID=1798223 RepID=UPI0012FD8276|nr:TetR/AcrR family transcriptional regulator [Leifsonia sp. 21MFCrub1.1]